MRPIAAMCIARIYARLETLDPGHLLLVFALQIALQNSGGLPLESQPVSFWIFGVRLPWPSLLLGPQPYD